MAKVTLTFDTTGAEKDLTWGDFLTMVNVRMPSNFDLPVKEGLSAPIEAETVYGTFKLEVTEVDALVNAMSEYYAAWERMVAVSKEFKDHRGTAAQREALKRAKQAVVVAMNKLTALGVDVEAL